MNYDAFVRSVVEALSHAHIHSVTEQERGPLGNIAVWRHHAKASVASIAHFSQACAVLSLMQQSVPLSHKPVPTSHRPKRRLPKGLTGE